MKRYKFNLLSENPPEPPEGWRWLVYGETGLVGDKWYEYKGKHGRFIDWEFNNETILFVGMISNPNQWKSIDSWGGYCRKIE